MNCKRSGAWPKCAFGLFNIVSVHQRRSVRDDAQKTNERIPGWFRADEVSNGTSSPAGLASLL